MLCAAFSVSLSGSFKYPDDATTSSCSLPPPTSCISRTSVPAYPRTHHPEPKPLPTVYHISYTVYRSLIVAIMGLSNDSARAHAAPTDVSKPALDIIDIRLVAVEINLKDEIRTLFQAEDGPRKLPTLLLYNERGLQIFEEVNTHNKKKPCPLPPPLPPHFFPKNNNNYSSPFDFMLFLGSRTLTARQITYLEEYYLTNDEIKVLTNSAASIAQQIPKGAMVIELGSG